MMISARISVSLNLLILIMFLFTFNSFKGSLGLHTVSSGRYVEGNQKFVSSTQPIYADNKVLAAKGGQFELGIFSPRNSTNFYVGIWCKNISVWVANRDTPILQQQVSNNSRLELAKDGTLILLDDMKEKTTLAVNDSVPVLNKGVKLENGNFIFSYGLSVVWQRRSFDYPTDAGKLKIDHENDVMINNRQILTSWENPNDPGEGRFSLGMFTRASPEFFMWNNQSQILWRSGAWNQHCFASFSSIITNTSHKLIAQTKYFTYVVKESIASRIVLTNITEFSSGSLPQSSEFLSSGVLQYEKQSFVLVALYITITLLICIFLICLLIWYIRRKINSKKGVVETNENLLFLNLEDSSKQYLENSRITTGNNTLEEEKKVLNLPHFSFSSISAATNNFSPENKLGQGGFGPVFKGNLLNGHSVAVKRLSQMSGQGIQELINETVLIAKLQHRNLVRLIGCCIEQDEKILIYEYMPNKSLDVFIFDPSKQYMLDWRRRVKIIEGIAQGLVYLHQHSRLCIIHRDLKASNILLDGEMNPKISDFGMARILGGEELQANTTRIAGTYGYMSPEYAMEGLFSIKSDVYSFGVLLLEILSGKKNTGFRHTDCLSLLGHAWELWKTERVLELICSSLVLPSLSVPMRFIHVGLLCVQECPADRPTMSDVLAMFSSNEHTQLVSPRRPAFVSSTGSSGSGMEIAQHCSMNDLTASVMHGR